MIGVSEIKHAEHPTTSYSGCLGLGYAPYRSAAFCLPSLSKCCQPVKLDRSANP